MKQSNGLFEHYLPYSATAESSILAVVLTRETANTNCWMSIRGSAAHFAYSWTHTKWMSCEFVIST
jgi:frataxin-like iron-binding protein CyaY